MAQVKDNSKGGLNAAPIEAPRNGVRYCIHSYQRVSKEENLTGSHTFETQTLRIRQALDERFGKDNYDLVETVDDGLSGAYGFRPSARVKQIRPKLGEIKKELLTRKYDAFIVYDLSRFTRSPQVFYEMLEDVIYPSGTLFLSATEPFDFNTAMGRAMGGVMSVVNGLFRDSVVKRNKDAAATRAEQGFFVGQPGYGWTWEKTDDSNNYGDAADGRSGGKSRARRGLVPVPEKANHVRRIVEQYLSGWSVPRITRELNDLSIPSPSGRAQWTNSVVFNVIDNPVHAGYIPWKGELLPGEHYERRLYDKEQYEQIKEARKRRSIMRTRTAATQVNLLLGFALCARCGRRLYISGTQDKWSAYRCNYGMAQGNRVCPKQVARAELVDAAVVGAVQQIAERPDMQALLQEEAAKLVSQEDMGLRTERTQLRAQLADRERQFEKWGDALVEGRMAPEQFSRYNDKLLAAQAAIQEKLAAVDAALASQTRREVNTAKVQQTLRDFPRIWHHLNLDERRQLLSLLLEDLRVDRRGAMIYISLKIALLPPQEICVASPSGKGKRPQATGVGALTPRQLALLYHLGEGLSLKEAAQAMGVSYSTVKSFSWQVQQELGLSHLPDAIALAKPRINALLSTLPLGQSADPRSQDLRELRLSDKLREVLPDILRGATCAEIAVRTGLPKATVGGRRKAIFSALGAKTLFEAVQKAEEAGLM